MGIIIGACVILLVIAAIVVGIVMLVNVVTGPADAANKYVSAINDGNFNEAYSYLTDSTQGTLSLSDFKEKVGELEGKIEKYNTQSISMQGTTFAKVVMKLRYSDGSRASWDMTLVKQNDKWKIQAIDI